MMRYSLFIAVILLSLFSLSGCKREEPTTWDVDVAAPLAYGDMNLSNLVKDSALVADENGLWHFRMLKDLTAFNLDSLVSIPDTSLKRSFVLPLNGGPFDIGPGITLVDIPDDNDFGIDGAFIKEAIMNGGTLQYTLKSYINGYLTCTYDLPGLTLNGVSTTIESHTTPGSASAPFVESGVIELNNYHMDFTGSSGNQFNQLYTHLLLKTSADAPQSATIHAHDSVVVELKFLNPSVSYARGFLGEQTVNISEHVDFADRLQGFSGSLALDQARMDIRLENYIGADAQFNMNLLGLSSLNNSSVQPLEYGPIYNTINITRAYDQGGVVTPTLHHWHLDQTNSNLTTLIGSIPTSLSVAAQIVLDPLGDVSDGNDFIYTNQTLKSTLDVDIPLLVGMNALTLVDTLLLTNEAIDVAANGDLYLHVKNDFPFGGTMNIDLLDETNQLLMHLPTTGEILPALVSDLGITTQSSTSVITIPVSSELIRAFYQGRKLRLTATFDSPNYPTTYPIMENYKLHFFLTAFATTPIQFQ